ncbi:sulfotransferase 1C4 [Lingula anatina]|uniref:Sulfotransferase 1C4 n=1 Tax=Lingula anatina TaxID=7574 RepID=A0A1S3JX02_LINAN|nr:sulfotransferase 1C4 [Lingula anatina]|eukprot:XP_013414837.1 sulfotransferase 1C4 [Lingula anatina]
MAGEMINGMLLCRCRGHLWPTMELWPKGYDWNKWFEELDNNFAARPDDLYIASFPKSGHHWSFEFINMIYNGNADSVNKSKLENFFEMHEIREIEEMPSPRILMTHLPYDTMPQDVINKKCKIICIMRNPKDVCASHFNHVRGIAEYKYDGDWNHFFELFLKGEVENGPWLSHVKDWWTHCKDNPNVLFLKYEDMKHDLFANIKRVGEFLGKTYDDDLYRKMAENSNFDVMKKNAKAKELPGIFKTTDGTFFRKGKIGDWKNYFTVAQNERFDAVIEKELKDTGLKFQYE